MAIIAMCILVLIVGFMLEAFVDTTLGSIVIVLTCIALFVIAITIPAERGYTVTLLSEAGTINEIIQCSNNSETISLETKVKAQARVFEINDSLRKYKMINKGLLDIWIPDEVDTAELIQIK